ncbi:hypothetical protein DL96DRAFT_1629585 [Flagelloscypha sp. PMI_526]|nr:hypothetical protein DL96DRAFT_1629585 [Flagelloscypha sp. PMI_526]
MSQNFTTFPGFDPKTYCLDLSLSPKDVCPGICLNKGVSVGPAIWTFLGATVLTGFGMLWLPNPLDRKAVYTLSFAQGSARFTNILVLYFTKRANPYDLYLNVFLVFGAELTALIAFAPRLNILARKHFHWVKPAGIILTCAFVAGIIAMEYRPDALKEALDKVSFLHGKNYGNQPACHFPAPAGLLAGLLVLFIAVLLIVGFSHIQIVRHFFNPSDKHPVRWRVAWSAVILAIDLIWGITVGFFIRSYLTVDGGVINGDAINEMTASQIFSIFLSIIGLLPPLKHLLEKLEKWLVSFWKEEQEVEDAMGAMGYDIDHSEMHKVYQAVPKEFGGGWGSEDA